MGLQDAQLTFVPQAGIPLAYIFAETPEERETLATSLKSVAEKHKGKVNFATIDAAQFGQHAGNLNLKAGTWPAFAIQRTDKNEKFPYDQDKKITESDIGTFVEDFIAGKVEPSVKSEPIPESQDGPVSVVVSQVSNPSGSRARTNVGPITWPPQRCASSVSSSSRSWPAARRSATGLRPSASVTPSGRRT